MKTLLYLLAFASVVPAAAAQPSAISGHVRLSDGQPVAGAQVALFDVTDLAAGAVARTTTDDAGHFAFARKALGGSGLPDGFRLGANYPNPFNPSTIIPYQLPTATHVRLEVFNLLGQRVATLVDGGRAAGAHTAVWDATDAAGQAVGAGVYIYRLSGGGATQSRRMVLLDGQAGVVAAPSPSAEWTTAERPAEPDTPVYGLTVSGEGLIAHAEPVFQVAAGRGPVELVVEALNRMPSGKAVATSEHDYTPLDNLRVSNGEVQYTLSGITVLRIRNKCARLSITISGDTFDSSRWQKRAGSSWRDIPNTERRAEICTYSTTEPGEYRLVLVFSSRDGVKHYYTSENTFTVGGGGGSTSPDLIVDSPSVSDNTLTTGQSFTLRATVRNRGTGRSAATTLRYYRSTNATVSTSDTQVGTDQVGALAAAGTSAESVTLTAPSSARTYYYGACVVSVRGESDTNNNCSTGVRVTVSSSGGSTTPDLIVDSPSVSDNTLTTGQSFTLRATVRNRGTGRSAATTLRYYRSSNSTITTSDTQVGTDSVSGLSAAATSAESIRLTAPASAGTYYYGACVESVSGESNPSNNCSTGVRITVSSEGGGGGGGDDYSNTRAGATSLSLGSSRAGQLETGGDVDYFSVQVSRTGTLTVYTTGSTDTHGTLENSSGSNLEDDDDGGSGDNFRIEHSVSAGTYYIRVRGFNSSTTGSYTVHVRLQSGGGGGGGGSTGPDLVVDSPSVGDNTLTPGQSSTLSATVRNQGNGRSAATMLRYYRSTDATISPSDTPVGTDNVSGLSASATSAESIRLTAPSSAGTYYYGACVESVSGESNTSNNCSTSVRVTVSNSGGGGGGGGGLGDDHSNTRAGATSLPLGNSRTGRLETGGDVDYFSVQVSSAGTLTVYTTGSTDTRGTLQTSSGSNLEDDADGGNGDNFRIARSVPAGTYYIQVQGNRSSTTGSYTVHARFQSGGGGDDDDDDDGGGGGGGLGDDHSNTRAGATSLPLGGSRTGRIGTTGLVRDVDYFRMQVSSAGTLTVYTTGSTDTFGSLQTSSGSELTNDGGNDGNFRIEHSVSAGTYYIRVQGHRLSTTGYYTVHARFESAGGAAHPDLVVVAPSVSDSPLTPGQSFTLSATVCNRGKARSASTTLRYYRSSDLGISTSDTQVGTSSVSGLLAAPADTNSESFCENALDDIPNATYSIRLNAPSSAGTYYYGACVASVSGESNIYNNCSVGREVEVSSGGGNDDHGNTPSDATSLSLGNSRSGRIETGGDVDYFRVQVSSAGTLIVYTTGSINTYGELEDSDGSNLAYDNDGGSDDNFRIEHSVTAGTYYILVEGWDALVTGSYTVHARLQ